MEKSDFLNQTVNRISGYIIDVTFAISTVLAPILLFLILRKSGKIGKYRWYLVNDVIWCYAFDLTITVYKPVALGPMLALYSEGPFTFNSNIALSLHYMLCTCVIHMGLALVMSIMYRFCQPRAAPKTPHMVKPIPKLVWVSSSSCHIPLDRP
ncbi:serpentine type 7TM GPCR chemoreceptor sri domain-containing protein [Ditylenchus destructor]|nr:serpentine type 7TM GPCR chemoreceptor sri domain-containing protein [Ditylenchus destructor]